MIKLSNVFAFVFVFIAVACSSPLDFVNTFRPQTERIEPPSDLNNSLETRALVIFNALSSDSKEIAYYYAEKRNIPNHLVVGVNVRNNLFGNADDLLSVRAQIINNALCPIYAPGTSCSSTNIAPLLTVNNLPTHLSIIKGIPTQLRDTGWAGSTYPIPLNQAYAEEIQPTSFDFYLAYSLLSDKAICNEADCFSGNNSNGFGVINGATDYSISYRGSMVFNPTGYQTVGFEIGSGQIPKLNPSTHRSFAYGRIDGITVKNAKDIIDRTLYAEINGIDGNFYGSRYQGSLFNTEYDLAELTGSMEPQCLPSVGAGTVYPVPGNPSCRVQYNQYNIPVSVGGNVQEVVKAATFIGQDLMFHLNPGIVHHGFANDFAKLLSWRVTSEPCNTLCSDFSNLAERENCENTTLDPYKTINTACVGVQPGFIGSQIRSFPVQFMGSYPKGWEHVTMGPATPSPMELSWEGGVQTDYFTDNRYVYFGDPLYRRLNSCFNRSGQPIDCDPKVEIFARREFNFPSPVLVNNTPQDINFSFFWKGYSAKPGRVSVTVHYLNTQNQVVFYDTSDIIISGSQDDWAQIQTNVSLSSLTPTTVNRLQIVVFSPTTNGDDPDYNSNYTRIPIYGHFAIDGFRARIGNNGNLLDLISADAGSFNEPYVDTLTAGSWAGDFARLGGSAFFGSLSHFGTNGLAWDNKSVILRSFFSGSTLGQSLLYAGTGISGIFYGDPLYSIGGPAVYIDNSLFQPGMPLLGRTLELKKENIIENTPFIPGTTVITVSNNSPLTVRSAPLYFDAAFGKLSNIEYRVELCVTDRYLRDCEWELLESGTGPIKNKIVNGTDRGIFNLAKRTGYHFVRVKVFPTDGVEKALYRYAKFYFVLPEGELPAGFAFSAAQLSSSQWDLILQEDPSINSLFSLPLRYGKINKLVLTCDRKTSLYGFPCNTLSWNLNISSLQGNILPSFVRSEETIYIGINPVKRTTFTFSNPLNECDLYNIVLQSGGYTVRFNQILNLPQDANGDRAVSQADFIEFRNVFGLQIPQPGYGDFDGNLSSSQSDFIMFRNAFGCAIP